MAPSLDQELALPLVVGVLAVSMIALLTGCEGGSTTTSPSSQGLAVVTSFYPLQFIAERIGAEAVNVTNLTKASAEPHDLELTPQDVAELSDADLAVYLSGFQPAVDDAINTATPTAVFDTAPYADLSLTYTPIEDGVAQSAETGIDPHFWLDPMRLADVGDALADELSILAPQNAKLFAANASALRSELTSLDADLRQGLAECESDDIVTSHNAFGYFADAYKLNQVPISGLTPESEPDPGALAAVTDFVEANNVRTIYYETLVSPDIANTVASATGAASAVLDPLEGLSDQSDGSDYFEVMQSNLVHLQQGQPCT